MSTGKRSQGHFNPRSREGSDRFSGTAAIFCRQISIHAPAKGATNVHVKVAPDAIDFNPRSREGSDKIANDANSANADFNPRSREGSDQILLTQFRWTLISIHAPAKGATLYLHSCHIMYQISIHAPAKGATGFSRALFATHIQISIHAPAKGATWYKCSKCGGALISIHAPAKGATPTLTI